MSVFSEIMVWLEEIIDTQLPKTRGAFLRPYELEILKAEGWRWGRMFGEEKWQWLRFGMDGYVNSSQGDKEWRELIKRILFERKDDGQS